MQLKLLKSRKTRQCSDWMGPLNLQFKVKLVSILKLWLPGRHHICALQAEQLPQYMKC